jgi:hypothetical protein
MDADEDRDLIRHALLADVPDPGPDLEQRVRQRVLDPDAAGEDRVRWVLALTAAVLALLVVAGVLAPRLLTLRTSPATKAASAAPAVHPPRGPAVVDPSHCRLPVVVTSEAAPPATLATEVGFVDTSTGRYTKDASASVAGLPGGDSPGSDTKPGSARPAEPTYYSSRLRHWLPVGGPSIAPNGLSYVWVRLLPSGSNFTHFQAAELHRYDVVAAADHTLWSYPGSITIVRWDKAGVLVNTVPPQGGVQLWWLIDPDTGVASPQPASADPTRLTDLAGQGGTSSYGSFGMDALGRAIFQVGSRTPGDQEWVFYVTAAGQRVTIYRGTQGDATGFDPYGVMADATGLWFGDYDSPTIWHWQEGAGLHKVTVTGQPAPIVGPPNSNVYVRPAGPCL